MKKKVILAFLSVVLVIALTATPVLAQEPDKGPKAGPFQELWDAVAGLQEQLDEAVSTLQGQIDEIVSDLDQLIDDIDSIVQGKVDAAIATLLIDWSQITGVPPDLDDGDDVGPGDGHSLNAADSVPVDAVYVNNDGEVGIGTMSPSEKLEVDGNVKVSGKLDVDGGVTAANFSYSSAKTKYKAIAASAFIPADSSLSWTLHDTVGTYIYLSSGQSMYANVDLPDGVTVTELRCWLYDNDDNDPSNYVRVYLRRQPLNSPDFNQETMASVETSGDVPNTNVLEKYDSSVSYGTVDNSLYKYSLKFHSPGAISAGSNCRLHSCRIKYTTSSPL